MKPTLQIILGLMLFCVASVSEALSSITDDHDRRLPANRRVILECMSGRASPDKNISCVNAYKYVQEFCDVTREPLYKRRYRSLQKLTMRFEEACDLSDSIDGKLEYFFEIDVKSCVTGHRTLQEQLAILQQNSDIFSEYYTDMYKRNSCREYRSYVNLCEFVDGNLKTADPYRAEFLPTLQFSRAAKPQDTKACATQNKKTAAGIDRMTQDLAELSQNPQQNVYKMLVTKYRSQRKPANAPNAVCEQVRNSYHNLGCVVFEKYLDEEPIYFNAEDFRENRIKRNKEIREGGQGQTAN